MGNHSHDSSASPPPPMSSNSPTPLPTQINAATRKQHAELNRLIIKRLPLGLPPSASDPAALGHGLAAFARIYFVFESEWQDLARREAGTPKHAGNEQVEHLVLDLRPPGLSRSQRLRNDLAHISKITGLPVNEAFAVQQQPVLDQIVHSIRAKPHVLIAFAWVMYMAIFSGGRWIRAKLQAAGSDFWAAAVDPHESTGLEGLDHPVDKGFSFLYFDGDEDGEDIKAAFKQRLQMADDLLPPEQKQDVVAAARDLFDHCISLVRMIEQAIQP